MDEFADKKTLEYYSQHVEEVFARYEGVEKSGIAKYFLSSFPTGCKVLDVGAGTGRDVRQLLAMGFDAYGAEPVERMRELAINSHPELKPRLFHGQLPNQMTSYVKYEGIVCSAVLMHLPPNMLFDSLVALRDLLVPQGRLLISIPASRSDINDESRDALGRLFASISADQIKLLCKRLALECIEEHTDQDALNRAETTWKTMLFVKQSSSGKPLDRIESVLRNDRKVASYKLALLRAFCDIAEQDDHAVSWHPDGTIGIPLLRLAELWLLYYWPLISTPTLIPQNNAEAKRGKAITFRKSLRELIEASGDYFKVHDLSSIELFSVFNLSWKNNSLPTPLKSLLKKTLTSISRAIVNGPVQFAAQGEMFRYDTQDKKVRVESDLWLEFCLTGYWVKDSLLLRWAELCLQFSKTLPEITYVLVLERLTQLPEVEREQRIAREIYKTMDSPLCVWTGELINISNMDVDHALPYSLWKNNDLWNLLPTKNSVNKKKGDRVPTSNVLLAAKDRIINSWQHAYNSNSHLFAYEVSRALGDFSENDWERPLFDHLKRKAEVAIFQRGAQIWDYHG